MNKIVLVLCLFLTACAHPVYIAKACPKPTLPPDPTLPIYDLKPGDHGSKVAKAYVMTVKQQQDWINETKIRVGGK